MTSRMAAHLPDTRHGFQARVQQHLQLLQAQPHVLSGPRTCVQRAGSHSKDLGLSNPRRQLMVLAHDVGVWVVFGTMVRLVENQ